MREINGTAGLCRETRVHEVGTQKHHPSRESIPETNGREDPCESKRRRSGEGE